MQNIFIWWNGAAMETSIRLNISLNVNTNSASIKMEQADTESMPLNCLTGC